MTEDDRYCASAKIMTVCAILFGLLPIIWSPATEAGADVMKRIATPMIGGIVTSAILELLIYPVIFFLWKARGLNPKRPSFNETSFVPAAIQQAVFVFIHALRFCAVKPSKPLGLLRYLAPIATVSL